MSLLDKSFAPLLQGSTPPSQHGREKNEAIPDLNMSSDHSLDGVLDAIRPLLDLGVSLHWLKPRSKAPMEEKWVSVAIKTEAQLRETWKPEGCNVGIRPGSWSKTPYGYHHVLDVDIRKPEFMDEAWAAVLELYPNARRLPSVQSGSMGESRHLYFLSDEPFGIRKLRKSKGFDMVWSAEKNRAVKKRHWEIDLCGTRKNVAIPPSIHPETGLPYLWERPLDFDWPDLMTIPSIEVRAWGVVASSNEDVDDDEDDFETDLLLNPLRFEDGELPRIIADLPEDWVDDYQSWVNVGMAFYHQFAGTDEGLEQWIEWSRGSLTGFEPGACEKKWPSLAFTKRHRDDRPFTFRSLISEANLHRLKKLSGEFDLDLGDGFNEAPPVQLPAAVKVNTYDLSDLLGDPEPAPKKQAEIAIDPDWKSKLHLTSEGELKTTLPNIALIFDNDSRTHGIAAFNQFKQSIVLRNKPNRIKKKRESSFDPFNLDTFIWKDIDPINGSIWHDSHDNGVRMLFEAKATLGGYGIKISDRDLRSAIDACAARRGFHPVQNEIEKQVWDGIPRVETLFIDYLKTEDNDYYRQAALLFFVGAVARIYRPGHKFDFVPILEGVQGAGKSTFIEILGLSWASHLTGDISDPKQMIETMLGKWILEIGELSAMARSDVNDLKQFVTQTVDHARLAWEKRARDYPRQCVFIGSTNDREYLRDPTGGRRWWPIVCNIPEGEFIDNDRLSDNIHQVWAEALTIFRRMETEQPGRALKLFMKDDAATLAVEMQESRRVETPQDMLASKIQAWLDTPMGDGFDDPPEALTAPEYRQETCTRQILEELLGKTAVAITQQDTINVGKALKIIGWNSDGKNVVRPSLKKYGRCRVYTRPS